MKKFLALFMTFIMVFCFSVSAVAAEPEKVNGELSLVSEETVVSESVSEQAEPRSAGDQIAFGATTISGGSGTLDVYLPSGNFFADLVAGIGYSSQNGSVTCSVRTPDGETISLGTISGSGSRTDPHQVLYAPAGTYTFYFLSAMTSPIEVVAYLFD